MTRKTSGSVPYRSARLLHVESDLPAGVELSDWESEKANVQNPSIRSYLGCIRLLEEVLDSNYAILHCSPRRVLKIWRQVREVCELMGSELSPLLAESSVIPALAGARGHAHVRFRGLEKTVLSEVERYPRVLPADQVSEIRKLLCLSIGKIYAFLRDTLGEILAEDPRSQHDADYFLSKRFAQDIEESEWLYASVYELCEYVGPLLNTCSPTFESILLQIRNDQMIPHDDAWAQVKEVLDTLLDTLVPKLYEVLTLRGIRVYDLEILDKYAFEIAHRCKSLPEVYAVGRDAIERIKKDGGESLPERHQVVTDLFHCHRAAGERMVPLLAALQELLSDLATYLPIWRASIEKRRALLVSKKPSEIPSKSATGRVHGGA